MSNKKSLRTIKKWTVPFSIMFLAAIAFFAFAATNLKVADNNTATSIWLRYDCSENPHILIVPGGPNYQENEDLELTGIFSDCNGFNAPCAVRFSSDEVEVDEENPGNMKPIEGVTWEDKVIKRCN